jgi:SAM-dependent methyltransferase
MSLTIDTTAAQAASPTPDFAAIKVKQQATWASGDFAVVGTTLQIVGESLVEAVNLHAGERVLDVAAGNGNATLAAARHFADVTSTDYVPALLDKGCARAQAEGLSVKFQVADVEALPFEDSSFDVVLSTYGVMFAPNHQQSSREMLRVTRSGGRIGLANWTPEEVFRAVGYRTLHGGTVWQASVRHPMQAAHLQLPLQIRCPLGANFSRLLRPHAQSLCLAARRCARRPGAGHC